MNPRDISGIASACDYCGRVKAVRLSQGPLVLRLCKRCTHDPLFQSRSLLRAVDDLQAEIQAVVSGRRSGRPLKDHTDAWKLASARYPNACLGMGSSRIAIAFGARIVAKVARHGGQKTTLRLRSNRTPIPTLEANLEQSAFWLSLDDDQAAYACPCFALSKGGVLWTRRAEALGIAFNPVDYPFRPLDPVVMEAYRDLEDKTYKAIGMHGAEIRKINQRLNGMPLPAVKRVNNWGWLDKRIVLVDVIETNPNPSYDERFSENVKTLAARGDDISLQRAVNNTRAN